MKFLVKTAFWLTIVLILLPAGGNKDAQTGNETQISASEAVSAASAAVSDMRGFCGPQPEAARPASEVGAGPAHTSLAGANKDYEFHNAKLPEPRSATATNRSNTWGNGSRHALPPADLAPAYRAPAPRKDAV